MSSLALRRVYYKQLCIAELSCFARANDFCRAIGTTGVASSSKVSMSVEMGWYGAFGGATKAGLPMAVVVVHVMPAMARAPAAFVVVVVVGMVMVGMMVGGVLSIPLLSLVHLPVKMILLQKNFLAGHIPFSQMSRASPPLSTSKSTEDGPKVSHVQQKESKTTVHCKGQHTCTMTKMKSTYLRDCGSRQ